MWSGWDRVPYPSDGVSEFVPVNHGRRLAISQVVPNFVGMQAGIDRDNAEAGLEASQHRLQELRAVPLEHGDTIALLDAQRLQRQRESIDPEFFLGKGRPVISP